MNVLVSMMHLQTEKCAYYIAMIAWSRFGKRQRNGFLFLWSLGWLATLAAEKAELAAACWTGFPFNALIRKHKDVLYQCQYVSDEYTMRNQYDKQRMVTKLLWILLMNTFKWKKVSCKRMKMWNKNNEHNRGDEVLLLCVGIYTTSSPAAGDQCLSITI